MSMKVMNGLDLQSQKITALAAGTADTDAVNKAQLDALAAIKTPVRVASTANVTVSNPGTAVFDGVTLAASDRILLKNQTTASENGIYTFTASGTAMVRAVDMDAGGELVPGTMVMVREGTVAADKLYSLTSDAAITIGTTAQTWAAVVAASGASALRFAGTIGDGSTTAIAVTHSLGTKDVIVSVRQVSDDVGVLVDWTATSTSVVTLTFAVAPASNALRVTVLA